MKALILKDTLKLLRCYFEINDKELILLKNSIDEEFVVNLKSSFSKINNKYFKSNKGELIFNPIHSGQKLIILYKLSNRINNKSKILAEKLYYLNKIMNACDIYPEVQLPEVFFAEHPVGSVLGRATYGNNFMFQQNCTVGGNRGKYPKIGSNVWLFAGSMILGDSLIGDFVFISAGSIIKDEVIPSYSVVYGSSPNLIIKNKSKEYFVSKSLFVE